MNYWILKSEPDCYNWQQMMQDRKTVWDGISNALALKNLRQMKKGDQALFYHTGNQRQAVGVVEIVSLPYADPKQSDEKRAVVDIKALKPLERPISLEEFKADPAFAGWDLLRLSRLSVVPVPEKMWKRIQVLAAQTG